jgi:hypothetical protein
MITKENLTDKLKTLAAGAALMAGIAMGTGCDNGQQINRIPTEDVVNDNDENNDEKPVDNNDTDNPIENNDKDDVIGDNDKDEQPTEKEDKDNKDDSDDIIDDNNKDDSDVNDNDTIENNDNDNIPSENNDSDNTSDLNSFFETDLVVRKNDMGKLTQAQIDSIKETAHSIAKDNCPYNYIRQPEQYDQAGNMYVVDKCERNIEEPMWLENATTRILFDFYGVPPPEQHRNVSMTVDYSSKGSQSNIKIKTYHNLILDVNFVSQSCLGQANEDTSIIEMYPTHADNYLGCSIDGEEKVPSIETKNKKQTKSPKSEYVSLCESMPNYELDADNNACYTTIEEFVWLENVPNKLLPKQSDGFLPGHLFEVNIIKRDLDTNVFYMTMQLGQVSGSKNHMFVHITLKNAKSCIDQCQGKEGCTSHIEPSQNASRGCIINGEEVKGEESAQRFQKKQHNLKQKIAPTAVKQHYAKNLRTNRQKWLAQNVRNFGRNGR